MLSRIYVLISLIRKSNQCQHVFVTARDDIYNNKITSGGDKLVKSAAMALLISPKTIIHCYSHCVG